MSRIGDPELTTKQARINCIMGMAEAATPGQGKPAQPHLTWEDPGKAPLTSIDCAIVSGVAAALHHDEDLRHLNG